MSEAPTQSTPNPIHLESEGCADTPNTDPVQSTATSNQSKKRCREKEEDIGHTRPLSSDIWKHFERKQIKDVWKAVCIFCTKALSGDTKNGTSHLRNHHNKCPLRHSKDIRQSLLSSKVAMDGKVNLGKQIFDQAEARKALASMIVLHEYPLSMVDHIGFRRYSNILQPLNKPVSRNTIKNDIIGLYEQEKCKSMSLLEANKGRIAVTTDMWTSRNQRGFMVVTAHFIDDSWILQNRVIRFAYVPHPHTAEDLATELVDTLVDWSINKKLSTITVDNCSTNDLMLRIIEDKFFEENLLLDGKLLHMRCAAHILNLVVRDGLDVIGDAIEKIRDSVAYWKATPKRNEEFEKMARKLKIASTKKLVIDCKTRWNSTYMMLEVALGYKDVFPSMKLKDKKYVCLPSEGDWKVALDICDKLKKFYQVSEFFSGVNYPTSNEFFVRICQLKIELGKWRMEGDVMISTMATRMTEKFDKYWFEVHGILAIATILDPRYKMKLVEFMFHNIYGDECISAITKVKEMCFELFESYAKSFNSRKSKEASTVNATSSEDLLDQLSQYDAFVEEDISTASDRSELEKYLCEPVKPRSSDFDVLAWWKVNTRDFPILALIAKDVFAIPVSTVASESAFSTSGRFVSPHRSRLNPATLDYQNF